MAEMARYNSVVSKSLRNKFNMFLLSETFQSNYNGPMNTR